MNKDIYYADNLYDEAIYSEQQQNEEGYLNYYQVHTLYINLGVWVYSKCL